MKSRLLIIAAFAATALSGCATYDHVGASAPGGYYQGRPQVRYYDAYGYPVYGGGGYGGGYYYGGRPYGARPPYYGYYGPYYPYYPPTPRPGHGHHDNDHRPPANSGPGGNRPAPWRDPTRGQWRDHGQRPQVPGRSNPPAPSARPPGRVQPSSPAVPRTRPSTPPPPRAMPRSSDRPVAPRVQPRAGGRIKVVEP